MKGCPFIREYSSQDTVASRWWMLGDPEKLCICQTEIKEPKVVCKDAQDHLCNFLIKYMRNHVGSWMTPKTYGAYLRPEFSNLWLLMLQ